MTIVIPHYTPGEYSPAQIENLQHLEESAPHWFWCGPPGSVDKPGKGEVGRKAPQSAHGSRRKSGKSDDQTTAGTLAQAVAAMQRGKGEGVGLLVRTGRPGLVGLDIDHCIGADGELKALGREVIKRFAGTYVELSPGRQGLRVFCLGTVAEDTPTKVHAPDGVVLEKYVQGQPGNYLRVTGAVIGGTAGLVTESQEALDWYFGQMREARVLVVAAPDKVKGVVVDNASDKALDLDGVFAKLAEVRDEKEPEEIIAALRAVAGRHQRGLVAEALRGSLLRFNKNWSDADLWICREAIERGAGSVEDVEDVWRASALADRDKFRNRKKDYRLPTIEKAARAVLADPKLKAGKVAKPWQENKDMAGVPEALEAAGEKLLERKGGVLAPTRENVVLLLRHTPELKGIFWFDEFRQAVMRTTSIEVLDSCANCTPGPLQDDDILRLGLYFSRVHGMSLQMPELRLAIYGAARDNRRNPVQERLRELRAGWDKQPRLDTWIERHCMPAPGQGREYLALIGRMFFIQTVARVFDPGCKADSLLIACGAGGGRKSSLFRTLADSIGPGLFSDTSFDLSDTNAIVEQCSRSVLVELAELDSMKRARDVNAVKAAISSRSDRYRRPYSSESEDRARSFTFCGSSNEDAWITDPSGGQGRRFWPFQTLSSKNRPMNLAALEVEAGLLWGEAVAAYEAEEQWFIDADLPAHAAASRQWDAQLANRVVIGPWDERLDGYLLAQLGYESEWSAQELAGRIGYVKAQEEDATFQKFANMLKVRGLVKRKTASGNLWTMTPETDVYMREKFGPGGSPSGAADAKRSGLVKVGALRSV